MEKEYIIVDSNNNWLSTGTDKNEALQELKEFKKIARKNGEYENMEVGETIYLYEAIEIKRI